MRRPRVLLVVSADDASTSPSYGPRKDYHILAEALAAATIDRSDVQRSGVLRRLIKFVGIAPVQAWLAFRERHHYDVIVTDGEHIGIPLALLLKVTRSRIGHVTIGHRLTAAKKRPMFKWLKAHTHMDRVVVHSRRQYELAVDDLGIPPQRLALMPYQVDVSFWQPSEELTEQRQVCSAGLEFRDYPTLIRAVDALDVKVIIGAASYWSKRSNTARGEALPDNVEVSIFDYAELREVYARSAIVVVPLNEIDFQAGITTILEAMAMRKPVIVTHTGGQTDVVEDRRSTTRGDELRVRPRSMVRDLMESVGLEVEPTGLYVPPKDSEALRSAINYLLGEPEVRHELGAAGRRTIERLMTVEHFAGRIGRLVDEVYAGQRRSRARRHALPVPQS
ncbi:MAG: glycosyltransferase family 4 protein [Chloroflexi bacterium]|nr:glycosyltransferase family 4 protein [Chloroflexota bacterium]